MPKKTFFVPWLLDEFMLIWVERGKSWSPAMMSGVRSKVKKKKHEKMNKIRLYAVFRAAQRTKT